jgi:hypothetical protein
MAAHLEKFSGPVGLGCFVVSRLAETKVFVPFW